MATIETATATATAPAAEPAQAPAAPVDAAVATDDATPAEKPVDKPASSEKPSEAVIAEILKLEVLDKDKKKVSFGSLLEGDASTPRVVVVFIRHFFCGLCQDYIRTLMEKLPPSKLASLAPATKLVVIGHGEPGLIEKYTKETGCGYPLYADPTRKIFEKFGFSVNLQQGKTRPAYMKKNIVSNILDSIRQGITTGPKALGGGKISQNGGEAVFENGKLGFFYRMKHTTDHTEVDDLEKMLSA